MNGPRNQFNRTNYQQQGSSLRQIAALKNQFSSLRDLFFFPSPHSDCRLLGGGGVLRKIAQQKSRTR